MNSYFLGAVNDLNNCKKEADTITAEYYQLSNSLSKIMHTKTKPEDYTASENKQMSVAISEFDNLVKVCINILKVSNPSKIPEIQSDYYVVRNLYRSIFNE